MRNDCLVTLTANYLHELAAAGIDEQTETVTIAAVLADLLRLADIHPDDWPPAVLAYLDERTGQPAAA